MKKTKSLTRDENKGSIFPNRLDIRRYTF